MSLPSSSPRTVLLLGSGALKIGEAGEFDYSGSQAVKALKEEGVRVVLVNPNIATVQTSTGFADRVYFVPVDPYFVERVIEQEHPDAIMLAFGGQTALNCGLALAERGVLVHHGMQVLGTPIETIRDTEDRDRFIQRLNEIDVPTPRSKVAHTVDETLEVAASIGYPVILRAAFALGGEGSGRAGTAEELRALATVAFARLPRGETGPGDRMIHRQVLIEEYLAGWKELEYEVVRDRADNCIVVCNMENVDPMGIHTGESIVVAPSQTLTNDEYHLLRLTAIRTIRHLGVVGECNIQFALDPNPPAGGGIRFRVIEVNARLSRSSALASKATGYPLAWVAAKLALGHTLPELPNTVTRTTSACFEPALDYVVVKYPRWDLDKFRRVDPTLGSAMKSVGEVMAIGRGFEEALQKAVRMLGFGMEGLLPSDQEDAGAAEEEDDAFLTPTPRRLHDLARALARGVPVERITAATGIDRWFVECVANVLHREQAVRDLALQLPPALAGGASDGDGAWQRLLWEAKELGISDTRLGQLLAASEDAVRAWRLRLGVAPMERQIDTLAAEYPAATNYLYTTYQGARGGAGSARTRSPGDHRQTALILGSGPYRIGSSVEFDWCTVSAARALRAAGWRTVMLNHNPETVSTDYDECDALYFEEISFERVMDICATERPQAVVLSVGGQTANNLAIRLHQAGLPILGTSPVDIDRAEDRFKFSALLDALGVHQPLWAELSTPEEAERFAETAGYPVLVRPSYVLSGSAMNVAYDSEHLHRFLHLASVSNEHKVVISKFIDHAREIEIDAVARDGNLVIYALSEHVENAGVHSGDATVMVPPQRLYLETVRQVKSVTKRIAAALHITGPFNIQFLARDNHLQVIECNLRASRSFPLVSKVTGHDFIALAIRSMLGEDVLAARGGVHFQTVDLDHVAVKAPQFSFARLKGADPIVRVEMASTGEVATFGRDLREAYLKSVLAVGMKLPKRRASEADGGGRYAGARVFLSLGGEKNKWDFLASARSLHGLGLEILATRLTSAFLTANNVPNQRVYKIHEVAGSGSHGAPRLSILDLLTRSEIDLLVNITDEYATEQFNDDYTIRRAAVDFNVPLLTNLQAARLFVQALARYGLEDLPVLPWDAYVP
ncbi:MAG TPA: carbamoyl-phosphate synthase (glutamine-hydrolyzing) large subunit [Chloroflexota bacterium]|nr:carbamoyl-phosphate synthase (glutamine-hydrolyzing) large subunit [Chloroflexota bacterium]